MPPRCSYKLIVEYDGSRFSGFQRQSQPVAGNDSNNNNNKNTRMKGTKFPKRPRYDPNTGKKQPTPQTVQSSLEDALVLWAKSNPSSETSGDIISPSTFRLRAAGRTDKGVHARGQVVAIDLEERLRTNEEDFRQALNSRLPSDICVKHVEQQYQPNWEPRLVALRKRYSYTMRYRRKTAGNSSSGGGIHSFRTAHDSPILWLVPWPLDDTLMDEVLQKMQGRRNFHAFCHKEERPKYESHILTLSRFDRIVKKQPPLQNGEDSVVECTLTMEAKAFRRSMCRLLVGFVTDVCRGRLSMDVVDKLLDLDEPPNEEMAKLVHAAPAGGLCLEQVWF